MIYWTVDHDLFDAWNTHKPKGTRSTGLAQEYAVSKKTTIIHDNVIHSDARKMFLTLVGFKCHGMVYHSSWVPPPCVVVLLRRTIYCVLVCFLPSIRCLFSLFCANRGLDFREIRQFENNNINIIITGSLPREIVCIGCSYLISSPASAWPSLGIKLSRNSPLVSVSMGI